LERTNSTNKPSPFFSVYKDLILKEDFTSFSLVQQSKLFSLERMGYLPAPKNGYKYLPLDEMTALNLPLTERITVEPPPQDQVKLNEATSPLKISPPSLIDPRSILDSENPMTDEEQEIFQLSEKTNEEKTFNPEASVVYHEETVHQFASSTHNEEVPVTNAVDVIDFQSDQEQNLSIDPFDGRTDVANDSDCIVETLYIDSNRKKIPLVASKAGRGGGGRKRTVHPTNTSNNRKKKRADTELWKTYYDLLIKHSSNKTNMIFLSIVKWTIMEKDFLWADGFVKKRRN
jgi:hypothetical protein